MRLKGLHYSPRYSLGKDNFRTDQLTFRLCYFYIEHSSPLAFGRKIVLKAVKRTTFGRIILGHTYNQL